MRRHVAAAGSLSLMLALLGCPAVAREAPPPAVAAAAQTTGPAGGWSVPVRLAKGLFRSVSVIIDGADHAHVAADGEIAGKSGIWYLTDRSGVWTHKRILADGAGKAWRDPSITLDANERVIVAAWRDSCPACTPNGPSDGIFTVSDRGRARGTFPSVPTLLVAGPAAMPAIRASGTRLAVAYLARFPGPGPLPALRFTTTSAGHRVTTTIAPHAIGPALRLDTSGRARIAYAADGGVYYASAASVAGGFSVAKLPGTSSADDTAALVLDTSDDPTIAWLHYAAGGDTIRYAQMAGSWPSPTKVDAAPTYTEAIAISLDSSSVPHILAAGRSVREETRVGSTFVRGTLASGVDALGAALRISSSGRELVLWATGAGLFTSERSL